MYSVKGLSSLLAILLAHVVFSQPAPFVIDQRIAVEVGYNTTTTVVFNTPVQAADYGSGDILVKPITKDSRIIKIKAAKKDFEATNITILTASGNVISIPVVYNEFPTSFIYDYENRNIPADGKLSLTNERYQQQLTTETFGQLISQTHLHFSKGKSVRRNQMKVQLNNIFIDSNQLFFKFTITNRSHIPYEIQLARFYIRDKTRSKKTTYLEREILPSYKLLSNPVVDSRSIFIVAFDRFTIADDKYFTIYLKERDGDRDLKLNLAGNYILHAQPISQ
jgi:conjugative transposon TraN protein